MIYNVFETIGVPSMEQLEEAARLIDDEAVRREAKYPPSRRTPKVNQFLGDKAYEDQEVCEVFFFFFDSVNVIESFRIV